MGGEFEEEVDFGLVCEEAVHFEDVGVVGEQLHLDLLRQLALHPRLLHLLLADHLDGQHEARPQISGHVDVPKPSLAQFATHLELLQRQFFALPRYQHAAEVHEGGFGEVAVVATGLTLLQKQFFIDVVGALLHEVVVVLLLLGLLDLGLIGADHAGLVDGLA